MTWLILSHALAIAVGAFCGWAAARVQIGKRETAAEVRGMRATVIAHSPEEAFRHFEGSR